MLLFEYNTSWCPVIVVYKSVHKYLLYYQLQLKNKQNIFTNTDLYILSRAKKKLVVKIML
jgi:hypothetical protein